MIEVNVELSPAADAGLSAEAEQSLKHKIKSYIGVSAAIRVHPPGGIPRSEGKARRVIDKREQ